MKKVFLFHGLSGSPDTNWLPWIQTQEEFKNVEFIAPRFPDSANPSRAEWLKTVNKLIPEDVSDTYLVGHSLGGAFIMYLLQQWHGFMPFAGTLLVSAPFDGEDWRKDEKRMERLKDFIDIPFSQINFSAILKKVEKGLMLHAKNDPIVPFEDAKKYKETLGFDLISSETGFHFTGEFGESYEEVSQALQKIINEN